MSYFTLVPKYTHCPYWNIDITINGKYTFESNSNIAHFTLGICPIIENIRCKPDKDDDELWMYPFCRIQKPCVVLRSGFPESIDFNKTPCPTFKEE